MLLKYNNDIRIHLQRIHTYLYIYILLNTTDSFTFIIIFFKCRTNTGKVRKLSKGSE